MTPYLSVIVPAFNEEGAIGPFIERMGAELSARVPSWEIVVVDDGSGDRTRAIADEYARADARIRVETIPHAGKGRAVRHGLLKARGDWRFIADADLSMPPSNIQRFLDGAASGVASILIGSREAPGSARIGEPWRRHAIGRCFNWIVRLLAVPGIRDTQCGFKLLSAAAVDAIVPALTLNGFAFDVELLMLARLRGFEIREVGIEWHARRDSRVSVGRGAAAFSDVVALRWRMMRGRHPAAPAAPVAGWESFAGICVSRWVLGAAFVLAAGVAYDLLRMPVQVYDAVEEILAASRSPSIAASFTGVIGSAAYLRPLRIAQIKALYDLAHGHYWLAYRGFHAALLVAGVLLFVRTLRVRTRSDACAALVALTVMLGLHTFRGTVQEAFPINHFLEMAVLSLVMLNLAASRGGTLPDIGAALTFVVAALTLESGLLTWVVAAAAWTVGMRGISNRGLAALTLLLAGYAYLRFVHLSTGVPDLSERSAGYLFAVLDPPELQRRFAAHRFWFYGYNVLASLGSVLLSEPQSGVLVATRDWLAGMPTPRSVIEVTSSVLTTMCVAVAGVQVVRRPGPLTHAQRLLAVAAAVIVANAVVSFSYTKDEIVSTAGVFYAVAVYAACTHLLASGGRRLAGVVALAAIVLATPLWSVRAIGVHYVLATQSFKQRNDWALLPALWHRNGRWPAGAAEQRVLARLRAEALAMRVPNPRFDARWEYAVWGER